VINKEIKKIQEGIIKESSAIKEGLLKTIETGIDVSKKKADEKTKKSDQ